MEQLRLAVSDRVPNRLDDFLGIFPQGVMPTSVGVLERNGRLLFIKTMSHGRDIADAQRKVYKLLVRLGEQETAPGAVTVICVWGLGAVAAREVVIFDHRGESSRKVQRLEELREWYRRWWEDRL